MTDASVDWHLAWSARAFVNWHRGRQCHYCSRDGCPELAWARQAAATGRETNPMLSAFLAVR